MVRVLPKSKTLAAVRYENGGVYPGFLFLRHALAMVIVLHHARILVRGERAGSDLTEIGAGGLSLQDILLSPEALRPCLYALVGSFFALSGFLVAGSAFRNRSVGNFLTLRILRLAPALLVEITLSAMILGPLVTILPVREYFSNSETYAYFFNVVGFVHYHLPGVFLSNPIPGLVNENLWTLEPELACYAILALIIYFGVMYDRRKFGLAMLACSAVIVCLMATQALELGTRQDSTRFSQWFIVYLFFVGVLFNCFADFVPIRPSFFFCSAALYMLLMLTGTSDVLAGFLLVYCTVYVGTLKFAWFDKICRWDVSYGLYLYGYPITQTVVFLLVPRYLTYSITTATIVAGTSLVLAIIFASLSWFAIEKPALRLKAYVAPKKNDVLPSPITIEAESAKQAG